MGVDIGQPRVDIGDAVRVMRGFRLVQQGGALGVGGEDEVHELAVAAGRFLLDPAGRRAGYKWSRPRRKSRRR